MKLSDIAIKRIKAREKRQTMFDGGGLHIAINPNGSKLWRLKYRFNGKEKLLSLGAYPDVSLKNARERRDEARRQLANGIDPGAVKQAKKAAGRDSAANSFEVVAREWFDIWKEGKAASTVKKPIPMLEKYVFPYIGNRPIAEINPPEVLAVLRRLENLGKLDSIQDVKTAISMTIRLAIQTGRRTDPDPIPSLKGATKSPKARHYAAITEPAMVGEMLRAFDGFSGSFQVLCALKLAPMLFVKPGELRSARWTDIDFKKAEWKYTVSKTNTDHLVPLSLQALAILHELKPMTGNREYVFPGRDPKKPMSEAAINAALRRLGFDTKNEITGHGFRAMARTLIAEELHYPPAVIEHQLAHAVPDALGTAYNRTKFLKERKTMMQRWADYLDKLKAGEEIIRQFSAMKLTDWKVLVKEIDFNKSTKQ